MTVSWIVIAVVIAYMGIMLFVGWYAKNKISSNKDFMVAGRRLGPILMAGTLAATEIGGGSSLGVVQQGMGKYGISSAWYVIAMGFAFVILTFLRQDSVMPRSRRCRSISAAVTADSPASSRRSSCCCHSLA